MGNTVKLIVAGLVLLAVGTGIGRYLTPAKVEEKVVEKIVEKEKKDIHTVTRIVERPDGTKETTIEHTDKSTNTVATDKSKELKIDDRANWRVSVGTGYDFRRKEQLYIGTAERRILGNISVGVFGTTDQQAGITVGIEF